ncbi:hypothetical protein Emtol_2989 [Emticicia oligotrophica DSM 17448]|uniref:DUF4007 domain-containing protein n=1 Tax=Emticicia oligotrophica (strain DSM 17448 / CIP 109782 / MTCC 6937 / GPTSA100-15) TaxID=929562 RepID=A0ABM5N428_EMTOG|nr:DUF4007 family protein [Emticicia oligotrophica]AFK04122.1 hypothetical protein Emtol_2989 [Emticicia oligotrophica DSM 17448]
MVQIENKRFSFSGHESFQCRSLWLKKGYDFINSGKSFNDEDAVVILGVGKNMVASIRYWMKAFELLDSDDILTELAHKLLSNDGWDPYLEDETSLWILHHHLVTKGYATIYGLTFNELRREKIEFTKDNFLAFIKRKSEILRINTNEKTVGDDFDVMIKLYCRQDSKDKEDTLSGLLSELEIIKAHNREKDVYFIIENTERPNLSEYAILYSILCDQSFNMSVSLAYLEQEPNSVSSIFALNRSGLVNKIEALVSNDANITYSDQAGIRELQFKAKPTPFEVLDKYYAAK